MADRTSQISNGTTTQDVNLTKINGVAVSTGNGTTDTGTIRATLSSDGTGQVKLAAGAAAIGSVSVSNGAGASAVNIQDGGNSITVDGTFFQATQPISAAALPLPSGASTAALQTQPGVDIGDVTINNASGASAVNIQDGGNSITVDGTVSITANSSVNISQIAGGTAINSGVTGAQAVGGDTAAAASDAGNPIKFGGKAVIANPTAVISGQRVNAQFDIYGRQIHLAGLREMKGNQQTSISSSTAETTIVTADATYKLDLYGLVITNTSATVCKVTIKDSNAGTTRFVFEVPATDTRGFMLPMDAAHIQAAANTTWTATCGTSIATIEISALFIKNL